MKTFILILLFFFSIIFVNIRINSIIKFIVLKEDESKITIILSLILTAIISVLLGLSINL